MKRKSVLMIEMVILFLLSLGSFDYSLDWFWDNKIKNGFVFVISVFFALLIAKEIIKSSQTSLKNLTEILTFMVICFVYLFIANRNHDGTVSKNLLNDMSIPIIGIITSAVGLYSLTKNRKHQQ